MLQCCGKLAQSRGRVLLGSRVRVHEETLRYVIAGAVCDVTASTDSAPFTVGFRRHLANRCRNERPGTCEVYLELELILQFIIRLIFRPGNGSAVAANVVHVLVVGVLVVIRFSIP